MTKPDHPDEADLVRFLAVGAVDEGTRAIERRVAGGDADLVRRLREALQVKDALVAAHAARPPRELFERTRAAVIAAVREREDFGEHDRPVYVAERQQRFAGVRSSIGADINLVCTFGAYRLNAVLHGTDQPDRFALSGQLIEDEARPVVNLPVALLVDRSIAERSQTDEFGEFEFGEYDGERFGIRVGDGKAAASIELKGDSGW